MKKIKEKGKSAFYLLSSMPQNRTLACLLWQFEILLSFDCFAKKATVFASADKEFDLMAINANSFQNEQVQIVAWSFSNQTKGLNI